MHLLVLAYAHASHRGKLYVNLRARDRCHHLGCFVRARYGDAQALHSVYSLYSLY
jgi:hypothetical protein